MAAEYHNLVLWEKYVFCFAMMLVLSKDTSPLLCHPGLDTGAIGNSLELKQSFSQGRESIKH